MITADTITDEQIRDLNAMALDLRTRALCMTALRVPCGKSSIEARERARARCAEILNARRPDVR